MKEGLATFSYHHHSPVTALPTSQQLFALKSPVTTHHSLPTPLFVRHLRSVSVSLYLFSRLGVAVFVPSRRRCPSPVAAARHKIRYSSGGVQSSFSLITPSSAVCQVQT
ncbi:hypothetical protein Dsin_015043 [Dipteronia sinensis]|uniref:Uncharacterized protein n=1 Tax=Dipteronia sinensis TaxID=43782 RepID=A0AAE0ANI2_9ROSI|nr:hypothetical protein Dsin_015043 [Dipteronia sinensis]